MSALEVSKVPLGSLLQCSFDSAQNRFLIVQLLVLEQVCSLSEEGSIFCIDILLVGRNEIPVVVNRRLQTCLVVFAADTEVGSFNTTPKFFLLLVSL